MLLLEDLFIIATPLLIIGVIIAFCFKVTNTNVIRYSIIYIYVIVVLGITLFPIPYGEVAHIIPVPHNFIPFKTISSALKMGITFTAAAQIGGNILIALPYGVYLGIRIKRRKVLLYCLLPLLFPIIIESLQFIISSIVGVVYRSFDIDDFILNLCGGYLGIVFLRLFSKIKLGIQRSNNRS